MNSVATGVRALARGLLAWRGRAAHGRAAPEQAARGTEAVVVLGYRNAGERANVLNRWRVRAGLRAMDGDGSTTRLVLTGGAVAGQRPEAELMAEYARERCGYRGALRTEAESRSTWENVSNVIPLIEDADRIKIVSHALHAEEARVYLRRQRPDLGARLVSARHYRIGEWLLVKPVLTVLRLLRRVPWLHRPR